MGKILLFVQVVLARKVLLRCKFQKEPLGKLKYAIGGNPMKQYWKIWEPSCQFSLASKYYMNSVVDNPDGMYIFLSAVDAESRITIQFPGRVLSYRTSVSLAALRSRMAFVDENQLPIKEDPSFLLVENSGYSKSIEWDSQGIYCVQQLVHFVLNAEDGIFEVITESLPEIIEGWSFEAKEQEWGPFINTSS